MIVCCRNCDAPLSRFQNGNLRIHVKSRVLSISKGGSVQIKCPECGQLTALPLRLEDTPPPPPQKTTSDWVRLLTGDSAAK